MNRFGKFILARRVEKGLGTRELARLVGVSPSFISMIENKGNIPSERIIKKLAEVFEGDPDFFLAMAGRVSKDIKLEIISSMGLWSHFIRERGDVLMGFLEKVYDKYNQDKGVK